MEEEMAIEKIRNAVEIATKKIIMMHDQDKINESYNSKRFPYEIFLNAMIYHELISSSNFPLNDVYMEYLYPKEASSGKRDSSADFMIKNVFKGNEIENLFLEVKTLGDDSKSESFILNSEDYFDYDIKRLEKLMEYNDSVSVKGVVIIANLTRYLSDNREYKPINILLETLKKILTKGNCSDDMVFILSDNYRAIAITAGEIKVHKA
jgi:hypothetical protein